MSKKKFKIAQVIPYKLSSPGGVREHALALTKEFRRLGHKVILIAPGENKQPPIKGVVTFGRAIPFITVNGSRSVISLYNEALWEPVSEFLDSERFDLIHIHSPEGAFLNWQILRAAKTTVVATFHSDLEWGVLSEIVQWTYVKPVLLFFKGKIDGSIAVSQTARRFARECFRAGDEIIPNGVDTKRFYPPSKRSATQKEIKILFVGRLERRKGVLFLIRALGKIVAELPVSLTIVGDGPERDEAENLVDELRLRKKVSFLGRVADEDLPKIYREADIFCSPAIAGESQGIVLLEAMASGLPLVVYTNPGYQELLKDYPEKRCLVSTEDITGLAQALEMLVKDQEIRQELGKWGRKKAEDYDWSKIAQEILSFYRYVIARRKTSEGEYGEFTQKYLFPLQKRFLDLLNGTVEKLEDLQPFEF